MSFRKTIIICLGILFLLILIITLPGKKAQAASSSFYLSPSSSQVIVGATVSAKVMISTDGAINAGEGNISFSSDILDYQSISTSGSVFTFWTSGPAGSATGVSFGGGLSNPGYSGSSGTVLTVIWKAKAEGTATISVSGSKILANDGLGTNIYSGSSGGTITVAPSTPETSSVASTTASAATPALFDVTSEPVPAQQNLILLIILSSASGILLTISVIFVVRRTRARVAERKIKKEMNVAKNQKDEEASGVMYNKKDDQNEIIK